MAKRGRGAIVNLSTMVADYGAPGTSLYGSSKAAINLLTKTWAVEYGRSGVRINAVSPGPRHRLDWAKVLTNLPLRHQRGVQPQPTRSPKLLSSSRQIALVSRETRRRWRQNRHLIMMVMQPTNFAFVTNSGIAKVLGRDVWIGCSPALTKLRWLSPELALRSVLNIRCSVANRGTADMPVRCRLRDLRVAETLISKNSTWTGHFRSRSLFLA
jgi:hypothetical protein